MHVNKECDDVSVNEVLHYIAPSRTSVIVGRTIRMILKNLGPVSRTWKGPS